MHKLLLSALVVFAAVAPINLDSQNTAVYLNKDSQVYATSEITSYDGDSELATVDANALNPASMTDLLLIQEKTYKLKTGDKTLNAIVDMTDPEIKIEGVEDGKSYKKATIKLSVSDKYLSTYKAMLNGTEVPKKVQYKATKDLTAIPNVGDIAKDQLITLNTEQLDNEIVRDLLLDGSLKQVESYEDIEVTTQGKYTLVVTASDSAGNEVKKTTKFNINDEAPTITVSGIDKKVQNKEFILKATIDSFLDEEHEIKLTKDGISIKQDILNGMKITQDGKYKLEIKVTDSAGNTTEYTKEFELDTKAPVISIKGTPTDFTNKDVTYTITTDNEEDEFIVKVNGELISFEGKKCENTLSAEGEYNIEVIANDAAGNYSNAESKFVIDKTAPTVNCNKKDGDQIQDLRSIVASGDDKYFDSISITAICSGTSKAITHSSTEKSVSLDKDGEEREAENENWHVSFTAYDKAGNETSSSFDVKRDNVAPTIQIMPLKVTTEEAPLIEDGGKTNSKVNITSNVADINLSNIKYKVTKDGTEIYAKEGTDQIEYLVSEDGLYEVTITAADTAGNTKSSVQKFTIDTVAPVVTSNAPDKCVKSLSALKFSADEKAIINLDVSKDNTKLKEVNGESLPYSLTVFNSDGRYKITGYAVDEAGNVSNPINTSIIIDSAAPDVSIEGIKNNSYINKNVTIKASVKELNYKTDTAKLTVNGKDYEIKNNGETSGISKTFAEEGEYVVTISATDEAGNTAKSKTLKFTIDKTAPKVAITKPTSTKYSSIVSPAVTISDTNYDKSNISLNKGVGLSFSDNFGKTGGTRTYNNFKKTRANDGSYTLTAIAYDKAGNTTKRSETFVVNRFGSTFKTVKVPTNFGKAGEVVIDETNVSNLISSKVEISKDAERKETTNYTKSKNGNTTRYSIPKTNFTEDGVYRVYVSSKDANDNESRSKGDFSFIVDNTAPVISYKGIDTGKTYKANTVKLYIDAVDTISDDIEYKVTQNGKNLAIKSDKEGKYVYLKNGYNQDITIKATDQAGNTATETIEKVTISTSKLAFFYTHKLLITGIGLIGIISLIIIKAKGKKKNDTIREKTKKSI